MKIRASILVITGVIIIARGGWAPAWELGAITLAWGLDQLVNPRPRRPRARRPDGTRRGTWPKV